LRRPPRKVLLTWPFRVQYPMLQVVIVGDHDSGKTTFLGLIYAALVRSGSDKTDDLRFHAALDSIEEITGLFQQLMSGAFPDSATKEGMHELSLEVGFRSPRRGAVPRLGSRNWTAGASMTLRFTLPGSLDEQIPGFLQGSSVYQGVWRNVLDGDAIIILVDSAKLAPKAEDSEPGSLGTYDGRVESLLAAIQRWRERGGRDVLHPIFVFSKFDSVGPGVLRAADVEATPPDIRKTRPRAAYAKALLEPNLPRTLAKVLGTGRGKLRFGRPNYFFSWVRTEGNAPGPGERIRLRRIDGGGWEPDYSRDEYLALVDALGEIAARTKE